MKILVLAGTREARLLSRELAGRDGVAVVASLAGRTATVADHGVPVRVGGFGGVDGLETHLRDERVDVLVDATHPFAATMPHHAAAAARRRGTPRLRLVRPPWRPGAGDRWLEVTDLEAAARTLGRMGSARVLLTVGRLDLAAFRDLDGISFVVRTIEPPDPLPLTGAEVLRARGPFTVADERALLADRRIDVVVTRNAGGDDAKLEAARLLGRPVVMVRRPPPVGGPLVHTVADALAWLDDI